MATKTVKYEDLKKRLDRALGNSNVTVIKEATDSDRDRVYGTIVQVVLGISDYRNVDSNDLKRFIKYTIKDFHSDKNPNLDLDKHMALLGDMLRIVGSYSEKKWYKTSNGHTLNYHGRPESQTKKQGDRGSAGANQNQSRTNGGSAGAILNPNQDRTTGGNELSIPVTGNKFNFQAYLQSVKKLAPWALGGAVVGLGASIVIPSVALSGLGTIRIVYSAAKFTNKIVSEKFLNGQPTPVDKVVTNAKDAIKNKYGSSKVYKGIEKINDFLKKPKTQWFINGMAVGYKIGNWLDLDGKVKSLFENKQPITTTVPNETANLQTEAKDPTVETTTPQETVPNQEPTRPIQKPEIEIDTPTTSETPDYSWLDVGKDGDKIDLSGMRQGYTDSYAARGAYTGQYEQLNKAVNLATKYATEANGTFISELRLPDGSIFTGNIGELLETGIDPSKIAARIANQNGDYAWGNLEDVLETLSKVSTKTR